MTAQELPQVGDEPVEDAPKPSSEGGGLRKQLEETLAENRALKVKERDSILGDLGLNPETGMGKMLAEKFDAGDVNLDNLSVVATQDYGVVVPAATDQHPAAEAIRDGNARAEAIAENAGSIAPPTEQDQLAQAEAEGDYATSMALKANEVAGWFQKGPQ